MQFYLATHDKLTYINQAGRKAKRGSGDMPKVFETAEAAYDYQRNPSNGGPDFCVQQYKVVIVHG